MVGGRDPGGTSVGNSDVQIYTNVPCLPATPTNPPSATPTRTATHTPTRTPTATPTASRMATSTPGGCPYTAAVDTYKASGNTQTFVQVVVSDAFGSPVPNAPVSVTIRTTTLNATTDELGKLCLTFPKGTGSSVTGLVSVNGPLCYLVNQGFISQSTNPHGCP